MQQRLCGRFFSVQILLLVLHQSDLKFSFFELVLEILNLHLVVLENRIFFERLSWKLTIKCFHCDTFIDESTFQDFNQLLVLVFESLKLVFYVISFFSDLTPIFKSLLELFLEDLCRSVAGCDIILGWSLITMNLLNLGFDLVRRLILSLLNSLLNLSEVRFLKSRRLVHILKGDFLCVVVLSYKTNALNCCGFF